MSNQLVGRGRVGSDEAHWSYVGSSSRRDFAGNPEFSQRGVTNDKDWLHPMSDVVYEDLYHFQDLWKVGKVCTPLDHAEETYLPSDRETSMESQRDLLETSQVAASEVVIDNILSNTGEYQQYVASVHRDSPQQYVRSYPDHLSQTGSPHQIETVPDTNRVLLVVQNASSKLEMERSHHLQYEVGEVDIFEGPFNKSEGAPPPHHVPILLSISKSQPRHPLCGKLDDESFDPVQKYNEGEGRGVRKNQLVDNMFVNRGQAILQYEESVPHRLPVSQSFSCRKPHGVSKALRHQRSTAFKAMRAIASGAVEPSIAHATSYVVQLDDLHGLRHAATKCQRYMEQPTLQSFRKMADSARRVGGAYNWTGAGRQQEARLSRIEQAPRFTNNSTPGSSSSSQQHLPSDSSGIRESLLTKVPATEAMRRSNVLTENGTNTTTWSLSHDHTYHRRHSSERCKALTSNSRQSDSIGKLITRTHSTISASGIDDLECTSVQILDDFSIDDTPILASATAIADENQVAVHQGKMCSWSLTSKSQFECSDQYNYSRSVQERLGSTVAAIQKPLKKFGLMRDEHGRLRRFERSQNGTLLVRDRPHDNRTSSSGRISTETRSGEGVHRLRSPKAGGTVWDAKSISDKHMKMEGNQVHQRRKSGTSHPRRVESQEPDDENTITDVVTIDDKEEELKTELIASALRSRRKKVGRPPKKLRGRLAKPKQAIRDAARAEKLATKGSFQSAT